MRAATERFLPRSFSASLALVLCCLRFSIISFATGDSSEEEAGDGAMPGGGLNMLGVTAVLNSDDLPVECVRIGVNGSGATAVSTLFDPSDAFSFSNCDVIT